MGACGSPSGGQPRGEGRRPSSRWPPPHQGAGGGARPRADHLSLAVAQRGAAPAGREQRCAPPTRTAGLVQRPLVWGGAPPPPCSLRCGPAPPPPHTAPSQLGRGQLERGRVSRGSQTRYDICVPSSVNRRLRPRAAVPAQRRGGGWMIQPCWGPRAPPAVVAPGRIWPDQSENLDDSGPTRANARAPVAAAARPRRALTLRS